jgi:hypothetical protein
MGALTFWGRKWYNVGLTVGEAHFGLCGIVGSSRRRKMGKIGNGYISQLIPAVADDSVSFEEAESALDVLFENGLPEYIWTRLAELLGD